MMFVVIDLETTGIHIGRNRIVSIAARLLERGTEPVAIAPSVTPHVSPKTFYSFVNPEQPNYARDINHVPDEFLVQCPKLGTVAPLFWKWLADLATSMNTTNVTLVGHNIDGFDEPMMHADFARVGHARCTAGLQVFKIDSMKICKYLLPVTLRTVPYGLPAVVFAPESYKQVDVYTFLFGAPPDGAHDSLGDVNALIRILTNPAFERAIVMARPDKSSYF